MSRNNPGKKKGSEEGQGVREARAIWVDNLGNLLKFLCKEMRSSSTLEKLSFIEKGSVTGCHLPQKALYTLYQTETHRNYKSKQLHLKLQLCPK